MAHSDPNNEAINQSLKEALTETLHEQRQPLHEVFAEVLEDYALAEAIREGRQTEHVERDEVFEDVKTAFRRTSCGISSTATEEISYIRFMNAEYTAVLKQDGDWWIGWIEEIPGVNCQERTKTDLLASLRKVLAEAIEFNRQEARDAAGEQFVEERLAL
jgi:predicted RNase H-like HicB family nuclease